MGLLDGLLNDEGSRFALGLLAAAGPTTDPNKTGIGARLQDAIGSVDQWKQQQALAKHQAMQAQVMQMQLEKAKQDALDQAAIRDSAKRNQIAAQPEKQLPPLMGDAWMPDNFKSGILPTGPTTIPAKPASFNWTGFANDIAGINPAAALDLQLKLQKDNSPIAVPQGTVLLDRSTHKEIFRAPTKPEKDDPKITQYEYALKNGYKGTFEQFVTLGPALMAAAQAPLRQAQTQDIYEENRYKLPQNAAGFSVSVGGKTYSFPDQKALNNFKMKAGIK